MEGAGMMSELKCTDEKLGRLIAGYELGALEEAQRTAFVEHAFDCPYCHEELYAMGPYMSVLRTEAPRLRQRTAPASRTMPGQRSKWLGAVAAVLVLGVLGPYLYFTQRDRPGENVPPPIDVPKAEYAPASENVRVGTGGAFKAAMRAYLQNDFQSAAIELEALIRLEPENTEARFYRGVSLLLIGKNDEATPVLSDAVDRAAATPLGEACRYYLALAHARSGHVEQARAQAAALIDMNGKYRSRAELLVRALTSR
ncbi:MAG: hypothetical protein HYX75_06970 [Acidobacteria bacterium]|nr:hypothetical protein [Acidobacteriota bacterium]